MSTSSLEAGVTPGGDFTSVFHEVGAGWVPIAFSPLIQHPQLCQVFRLSSHLHPKAIGEII